MGFDGIEANSADSNRRLYGNNRYLWANLRRWLNSNANAGQWYSAAHPTDAPPNATNISSGNHFEAWAGFMQLFPNDFLEAMLDTTLTVARNTVIDGGGSETVTDKFFLASTTEVGLANENNIVEGTRFALFSDNPSRIAIPTQECVSNANGYTSGSFNTTGGWHWWLRTPLSGSSCYVRGVNTAGGLAVNDAYNGSLGLRPLCNLPSAILVSDTVNSRGNFEIIWKQPPTPPDGITVSDPVRSNQNATISWGESTQDDGDPVSYILERQFNSGAFSEITRTDELSATDAILKEWNTVRYRVRAISGTLESAPTSSSILTVVHNQPPDISGQDENIGVKNTGFGHEYVVTDYENDPTTVAEAVNGAFKKSFDVVLGATNTAEVQGHDFAKLAIGNHELTITAQDDKNNTTVRTLTFTKQVDGFTILVTPPLEALEIPSRASIVVQREIPTGAFFKVELCNNPYDSNPFWEDATMSVLNGTVYVFINKVQTAIDFGLGIRITAQRNNAIGPCWVSSIGGNFE